MYVCGPTVYDLPHLGHGRFSLVFDVLRRYLRFRGLHVRYVSNITDVDDKILERARREGRTPASVTEEFEAVWWESMDALGVLRPDEAPRATAWVPAMVDLITELVDRSMAYEAVDGVYLDVDRVPGYGLLALQPLESLRSGARVEQSAGKRSPLDFALWKKVVAEDGSEGSSWWSSPWGPGRPGWHTECVVMSLRLLGDGFDLHGGGQDLRFPHHENERAQAVAAGRTFAGHWAHNGFVEVEGEKMSKSLGNFTSLRDLLARSDARAYRLLVLRSHYRRPIEISQATVADAEEALARLDALARRLPEAIAAGAAAAARAGAANPAGEPTRDHEPAAGLQSATDPQSATSPGLAACPEPAASGSTGGADGAGVDGASLVVAAGGDGGALAAFTAAMDDDLDTPGALARLFDLVRRANAAADAGDGRTATAAAVTVGGLCGALGLDLRSAGPEVDARTAALVKDRDAARVRRDWARADAVRSQLVADGWVVEDGPTGTRVRRA